MSQKIFKRCACSRLVPVEADEGWTFAFGKCPACGAVMEWRSEVEWRAKETAAEPAAQPEPQRGESASEAPRRTLLRYHGGKWKLAPWILEHFPRHRVYVELFGGGGSVLLRKPRSHSEVYNDLDSEIVNLFRTVRDHGEELIRRIYMTPFAREEFELAYEKSDDPIERARRALVRAGMAVGQNGFHRRAGFAASTGSRFSPGQTGFKNLPPALAEITERLRGVVIENRDALEVIAQQDSPETLFYADPPYMPETRDAGRDYTHEMTPGDHEILLSKLNSAAGMVVLSGYRCPAYDAALSGWVRYETTATADIGRKGIGERTECLWLNPAAQKARAVQPLRFEREAG